MTLSAYADSFQTAAPTLTETISRALRQAILDGALVGGESVRQEEIARTFGVSRVPIREALLKLEGEGLVETVPRRGVIVTSLSSQDFDEILEMRLALESLAIERAAQRFTAADAASALQVVEEARQGMRASNIPDLGKEFESRWGDLNWEFHRRLYLPAGRPRLLATIENLQRLFARHLRVRVAAKATAVVPASGSREEDAAETLQEWASVLDEHEQMVRACAANDAATALAVLRHHISDHGTEAIQRLKNRPAPA